jgi:hypothetical protein
MFGQHAEQLLPHHGRQVSATASLTGGILLLRASVENLTSLATICASV